MQCPIMFNLLKHTEPGYEVFQLHDSRTGAKADIIPELGGMVHKLAMPGPQSGNLVNILEFDSPGELKTNPLFRGRLLFPFNDRIPKGIYHLNHEIHQLPINDPEYQSAIHGLIYNRCLEFVTSSANKNFVSLTLLAALKKTEISGYPFSVSLEIKYILDPDGFSMEFSVVNVGDDTAPISVGWHPYFAFEKVPDKCMLFHKGEKFVEVDKVLIPTGKILPVKGTEFDFGKGKKIATQNIDVAVTAPPNGNLTLILQDLSLRIHYTPELFKYTQIYTPEGGGSIALEPVSAATNAFNLPELGLILLQKNETVSGAIHISYPALPG